MGEARKKKEIEDAAEAKEAKEQAELESLLPEELRASQDYLLLQPLAGGEKFRGSSLFLPEDMSVQSRDDRIKKQFGTVIERPRFDVLDVGPDVKNYKVGDEVIIDRKCVSYNGTAINLTGYGVHFFAREENICGHVVRLSPADAEAAIAKHKKRQADKEQALNLTEEAEKDPTVIQL